MSNGISGKHSERTVLAKALRAIQGDGMLIYAVRTNDDLIKIGATTDFATRRHHIKGGTAEILALRPGTRQDELDIHRSLAGHATDGREYYLPTPSVLQVVNAMRAPLGLEPIAFKRRWAP